jgi:hypothetical protein
MKSMPHLLFPDFLKDHGSYTSAQRYWETLWTEVLASTPVEQAWTIHWMHNPSQTGNPIFTAICSPLRKSVRIIQEEPGDVDDVDLDWWLDDFGDPNGPDVVRELVIACCPSVENSGQVRYLLGQWVGGAELTGAATERHSA